MKILKLGTRKSLLAWAQSSAVAREVEKQNTGIKVELVGIETQGDKILDKPLSQIDGKEFFTAELDHALIEGKVDFTVHSMKDLALERPQSIQLAAIPARELQHDIIVFNESVIKRLREGKEIRIGTSSPRRLTLVPLFLNKALPSFSTTAEPKLKFVEIRGNVNTRLSRIHEAEGSEKKLDGVVLAFAGLERLTQDEKAAIELWKLLEHTKLMVLPLAECPTAPAQGALAIECHKNNTEVFKALQKLHHPETQAAVKEERLILEEWGGGCHQKLGANFVTSESGSRLIIRGEKPNGEFCSEIRNLTPKTNHRTSIHEFTRVDASDLFTFDSCELSMMEIQALTMNDVCFIAHSRAFENLEDRSLLTGKKIWVSGSRSWFKLAAEGIWVEGSLENKGFNYFKTFQNKLLLRLNGDISFLTHLESEIDDLTTIRIATYTHVLREIPAKITAASHLFWSSSLPFEEVWSTLDEPEKQADFLKKTHASGVGKTAAMIRAHGIEPVIFENEN